MNLLERLWAWLGRRIPPEFYDFWGDDEDDE